MRERVQIQVGTETSDGNGGKDVAWSTTATVWASIQPMTGREAIEAGKLDATLSHKVCLRYSDRTEDLTPKHRLKHGTRVFEIASVRNIGERNREIELMCAEVTA